MSRPCRTIAFTLAFAISIAGAAGAATKPKAKPKAPAKKPATAKPHYVRGTAQLPGEWASFGVTYTLGKDGPWNVTMKSAEYTVEPLLIGNHLYVPNADQKLLVLHFSAHNAFPGEALLRADCFPITVVDPKDQNWEYIGDLGSEKTKEVVDMMAKPAQKVDVYTAVIVPAAGEMPKLMLKAPGELVFRYDLRGKVKGMSAPFADANDKTGATALDKVPAQLGINYPFGQFDLKIESASFSDKPLANQELDENSRNLILTVAAKNRSKGKEMLRCDVFTTKLADADGALVDWQPEMYSASRNAVLDTTAEPGQEIKFRYIAPVARDVVSKSLTIQEGEGRIYVYDLSGVK